ncbi:competence type IV pilus minor pilin ComGF [Staphylococcus ratti]|uniref:Prepilin-type N-terminal cleavage/methylation domain-containing protein n=1 Tax=Staphylococcus ratti TaxID=2892440 RepID=A0ABY3P9W4_9STAP|nr:competence type IV pilus minor pilin ComGF [Staphylococcus ratti]UEX89090.1 prepilin-type N-terminal cleavage/methylation domain-containing protein [Staphylococcus ratti]
MIKNIVIQNNGFTLIESLIGLMIQTIIISLIPILIIVALQFKTLILYDRTYILEMMVKEISQTKSASSISKTTVHPKKITIPTKNETITYTFDNQKIVKSVNGKGNITVFNQVHQLRFRKGFEHHIILEIKYLEGKVLRSHEIIF